MKSSAEMAAPEDITMDEDQLRAYQEASAILQTTATFLAPLFSLVPVQEGIPSEGEEPVGSPSSEIRRLARSPFRLESTSGSPARPSWFSDLGNLTRSQPLQEALKQLEGLEKEEACLVERSDLSRKLTQILTEEIYQDTAEALSRLTVLGEAVPRRVCQHPFRKNDIVWVCRTCQADETCVLCHSCFSQSDHVGHDIHFYHAQAGGCCDCGDPDAWDPAGFCPFHGPNAECSSSGPGALPPSLVNRVHGVVPAVVDWLVRTIAENAEQAYARVNSQHEPGMQADSDLEIMDVDDVVVSPRSHIFSPTAASTNRSQRDELFSSANNEVAYSLGRLGSTGRGLFLILHADDIHVKSQVVEALRHFWGASMFISDMVLNRIVDALKQYGQLVIWGASDICAELTSAQAHLWMDGDKVACTRVGELVLERAHRLLRHGMFCSVSTYDELLLEQQAVGMLQWLSIVARSCDPLCLEVAACILPNRHLVPLLRSDFKMSSRVTKAWYSLLLTLLAVPTFKSHLAAAYCDTYGDVTSKYARGMGVLERSGYTLSVQFLNRVTYVIDLVESRDLLGKLGKSLLETMIVATKSQHYNGRLDPNHFVLAHRRYSPCVSDLKCVLNVAGMPRVACCSKVTFLGDWVATLAVSQFMDPQYWRSWSQGHIEDESRGWVGAFNASISLGSLFERLLGWQDDDESPIKHPDSPLAKDLMTFVELTFHIVTKGIGPWQLKESETYHATSLSSSIPPHKRCSRSLPFSTVASKRGTTLAMRQLPVSQMTPFSFHLPLHRFAASAIRELCLRKDDDNFGMHNLMQRLRTQFREDEYSLDDLFLGLMEFPLLVLSRVAQVRSDLWKRNGPGLNDQVLNYAEPPFCRNMRDADLLVVQFSVLGRNRCLRQSNVPDSDIGMSFLTNLLLHRFGIFDFVGFFMAPNSDTERYKQEADSGLYPLEVAVPDAFSTDIPLPWTYSPARDTSSRMKLLEECLHFMIVFISELPPVVPNDRDGQTIQAKQRLFREVIHRLASGPKTHSELSEVHHVLSHWDNVLLSEEGKLLNPDDATGAALGTVLSDVADRRVSRGKPEPDKWELRKAAWAAYDPAFFHISLRHHQVAAESRPKPNLDPSSKYKWESMPYAPMPSSAHQCFARLRRDASADASVLALAYKVLHLHFRRDSRKELADLRGREMYESKEMSETAVARAVHLLTLAAYAWDGADNGNTNWRYEGGGSAGSIFFDWQAETAPTVTDWINYFLLEDPSVLLDCEWYQGEENALVLLQKLAKSGGESGTFIAQDASVRSGAAWICAFASRRSERAASYLDDDLIDGSIFKREKVELDIERRKRLAKEKALARMNAQAAKFATMMDVKLGESEETSDHSSGIDNNQSTSRPATPNRPIRAGSFGSSLSSASSMSLTLGESDASNIPNFVSLASDVRNIDLATIPQRLLQCRPRCIICNDEDCGEARQSERMSLDENDDGESQRKKSRRRGDNALGFVGYTQASTALKGGGGPPPGLDSSESTVREFVGTHVALCGHAVHFECCESYLATVSHREDRAIGKRDEFRCPLCQRLSNCLVPFIDVGVDWIESPTTDPSVIEPERPQSPLTGHSSQDSMVLDSISNSGLVRRSRLNDFLECTNWWVSRHDRHYGWDGHSAFVDKMSLPPTLSENAERLSRKPARKLRSLKKKDLYAAWNAMMRTPRYVKSRLRPRSTVLRSEESLSMHSPDVVTGEESSGETVVWRRFLDQITDISYKADSKRLGDEQFHSLFGEFRHFVVEKHAYNTFQYHGISRETRDWPSCMFEEPLSDQKRQEMSREKLLSKFFMAVQSFTYSCSCETYDAKRAYQRSQWVGKLRQNVGIESIFARYGISQIECGGNLVLLPPPSAVKDSGEQPFEGRLGKLRYLALAIMSAAGAVSADLIQLSFGFPTDSEFATFCQKGLPMRAPVVYPILLGHVMTHVAAAMFASCGRARAQGDSIDTWQIPVPSEAIASSLSPPPYSDTKRIDRVVDDCENFIKLGMVARVQQILLGRLEFPVGGASNTEAFLDALETSLNALTNETPDLEKEWMKSCVNILQISLRDTKAPFSKEVARVPTPQHVRSACHFASAAAYSFVSELCTILQLVVPGTAVKYSGFVTGDGREFKTPPFSTLEELRNRMGLERLSEMIEGKPVQEMIVFWYESARDFSPEAPTENPTVSPELSAHLRRTQGFRHLDWPSACSFDLSESKKVGMAAKGIANVEPPTGQPHLDSPAGSEERSRSNRPVHDSTPNSGSVLVTFSSKKSVPLLGGVSTEISKTLNSPKVVALPTSYTDLYAELGSIMPDCEQTAVCLICGFILNAGGKGECTRHSYRCGAGAGMFFLLQECSGLIMHKSKAAYIHSPYVDSHGETPQYRGRPLNLDLDRYDHLREIWFGHGVRQQVVAERGSSRQVILPDFY